MPRCWCVTKTELNCCPTFAVIGNLLLLKGRGNARNIVCPVHRWTYDMNGTLLGAPHFPENPCLNLGSTPLQNWNGLLFTGKRNVARDLANLSV